MTLRLFSAIDNWFTWLVFHKNDNHELIARKKFFLIANLIAVFFLGGLTGLSYLLALKDFANYLLILAACNLLQSILLLLFRRWSGADAEWRTLINYLGGATSAHTKLISSGTNESGFSAVSSPILCGWGFLTELAFWSSTPYQNSNYRLPYANYFSIWEENSVGKVRLFSAPQSSGFCVRCLKDNNSQ